jgi:hypothetical protein
MLWAIRFQGGYINPEQGNAPVDGGPMDLKDMNPKKLEKVSICKLSVNPGGLSCLHSGWGTGQIEHMVMR